MSKLELSQHSRANLDLCVHCGFCLPACPTYRELGVENDSPRGRIHLIESLASGRTEPTAKVLEHLDLCLACRACEPACPSGVKYGVIIEDARSGLEPMRERSFLDRQLRRFFLRNVFPKPSRLRWLARALRLAQRLGLDNAAIRMGFVRGRMARMAETARVPHRFGSEELRELTPATGGRRSKVALLQGCVNDVMFGPTNVATVRVLTANGCDVAIPVEQTCCGALAVHFGEMEQARQQARRNIDAFLATGADAFIVNAAGCGSTLKEYDRLLADDAAYSEKAKQFVARVKDVSEYLASMELAPPKRSVPMKVAYQDACHLAHGQGIRAQPRKLLASIPGIELVELPESDTCCGSAGMYNIVQPEMADTLLKRKMANIAATGATVVVSANAGCLMQLKMGVREFGPAVDVMHVVDLLDKAYG